MTGITQLIERGDLDGLIRHVDRLQASQDWPGLLLLRDRCRAALERGHQLWPVASLCEYRLALHAPASWAGRVVLEDAGRFSPGPLAEVVASSHTWEELVPHIAHGPLRTVTAHERVLRGEDLTQARDIDGRVLDLPLVLQPWEPAYLLATYSDDGVAVEEPDLPRAVPVALPQPGPRIADTEGPEALRELVRPWLAQSNGRADAVAVEGRAEEAIAALGVTAARAVELEPEVALAYMAWTGASGGAHGRRRGAAAGRFNAWWAAATVAGLDRPTSLQPEELGHAVAELRWLLWDTREPEVGWRFRLAIQDPIDGLAWAIAASDVRS